MTRSVLIIDVDPPSVKLARTVLEEDGWRVAQAPDAAHAGEMLASFRPDLIVLTLIPPMQTALANVRATSALARDVPIVAVSAQSGSESEYQALRAGCAGYIVTPIDITTFSSQLRTYLGAHR